MAKFPSGHMLSNAVAYCEEKGILGMPNIDSYNPSHFAGIHPDDAVERDGVEIRGMPTEAIEHEAARAAEYEANRFLAELARHSRDEAICVEVAAGDNERAVANGHEAEPVWDDQLRPEWDVEIDDAELDEAAHTEREYAGETDLKAAVVVSEEELSELRQAVARLMDERDRALESQHDAYCNGSLDATRDQQADQQVNWRQRYTEMFGSGSSNQPFPRGRTHSTTMFDELLVDPDSCPPVQVDQHAQLDEIDPSERLERQIRPLPQ